jgi:hypothetical protein
MKNKIVRYFFLALISVTLSMCNNNTLTKTVKLQPNDPFMNTIVKSQLFEIDSKQDNVIEGNNGTVIVCPKGCFKNANDETVEENIKIELSEALKLEDMLLSNLTTTSNDKQLETDGMIYFNATANGEQLKINKDNPIHIEIPTTKKKAGMMAYKGVRDKNGNMNWIEPKDLEHYLVTVDIKSLDFLPQGFQTEVEKEMPYKNYKTATQGLTDSLYYNLEQGIVTNFSKSDIPTDYNEPYYNKSKQVVNGKYTDNSFLANTTQADSNKNQNSSPILYNGINPATIKVIKSEKYQNTFIATREFEARLKVIFKTCNNTILEIFIKNLDKNLYEVDSLAAIAVGESEYRKDFINFSQQRLTKVKQADKYADLLKGYYEKQLQKVKSEIEKGHQKLRNEQSAKNEKAQKVADDYKKLLWKREKYRMEKYSFQWSETGWINIDNGTLPKDWFEKPLEITVQNGKQFDRVYTYVVYTSIKSLYRLNTTNNELFYVGNNTERKMFMPKKELGVAISIGYKDEKTSLAIQEFITGTEPILTLTLSPSSIDKVNSSIKNYERYDRENEINIDLEFMAKFYVEKKRQEELVKENEFIARLSKIAFPCFSTAPTQEIYVSQ